MPAFLMTPIAKIVLVGVLFASIWGWGFMVGKKWVQDEWDASITQQAINSAKQVIAEAQMSSDVLKAHDTEIRAAETKTDVIEREVVKYVRTPTKPCPVDTDFVHLFDRLSGLPGESTNSLSTSTPSPGEPVVASPTDLTTTEVLQAYERATEELMWLWIDYAALVQWERGRYIVEQTKRENP